jgi:AraC-like DNA-binding protein
MGHEEQVFSVSTKVQAPGYTFSCAEYDECQFIYVTEGRLHYHGLKEDVQASLGPHEFVLLREGGAFRLYCEEVGYRGFAVQLLGKRPGLLRGEAVVGIADGGVRSLSEMIRRHMGAPVPESPEVLAGLGRALVWEVMVLARERQPVAVRDWADAARTVLDLNIATGVPVREALASLPLCYRQLCRCFRERFGTSPKAYQDLVRVDEARRLLRESRMDITSIAIELGFSSSQHFAARFRRVAGCTPTVYRRSE